ncbi:GGDEF domain-containing response regulator [Motiliproteus sp. SC1-56]|uniref:two-component system response regulator n=1 Tax=Motiliproteus sp. SC1-56 TaxID=2799565 RepID=UPI001A902FFC
MKVTIIEDNPDHLELTRDAILEALEAPEVRTAATLAEGLEDVREHPPDVLLCDLKLPDSGPKETIVSLRSLDSDAAVVVLTSHYDHREAENLVSGGIQDYLPKDELTPRMLARVCRYACERQRLFNEVRRAALYDALTGLPNRAFFQERLREAIHESERHNQLLALAYIDLDGFKAVNDSYGHKAGDVLLRDLAQRLKQRIRRSDFCARIGGDELAWMIPGATSVEDVLGAVEAVRGALSQPYALTDPEVEACVGASIGVAFYPLHSDNMDRLMHLADLAMYQAKRAGKGKVVLYQNRP